MECGFTYPRAKDLARNVVSKPTINMMIVALNICVIIPEHINVVKGTGKATLLGSNRSYLGV